MAYKAELTISFGASSFLSLLTFSSAGLTLSCVGVGSLASTCPEMLIELPVMANVIIFIFHNDIHDSFNSIHGVQLMLSWQQWL